MRALAIAAVALFPSVALADGMPSRGYLPADYNWGGIYVGGQLGGAWSNTEFTWELPTLGASQRASIDSSSFIGGGQVGVLGQFGHVVAGIEVSYAGLNASDTTIINFVSGFDRTFKARIDDELLVVGRLGYAQDRWLAYVKGGYANSDVKLDVFRTVDGLHQTRSDERIGGFTVGGGLDYAIMRNLSLGVEYNYVKLGSEDVFGVNIPPTIQSNHRDIDANISSVLARLNYKFDWNREYVPLK